MDERYCFLKNGKGGIAIAFKADEHIVAGADFKLFDMATKNVIESWKSTIDKGNTSIHRLKTSPDKLDKMTLSWAVVCCSSKRNAFEGNISLAVTQGIEPVRVSVPMSYSITNISPCGIDSNESFQGNLVFLVEKDLKENI